MSKVIRIDQATADKAALAATHCTGPAWVAYCKTINEGIATKH
jgi:hypothetical protein